ALIGLVLTMRGLRVGLPDTQVALLKSPSLDRLKARPVGQRPAWNGAAPTALDVLKADVASEILGARLGADLLSRLRAPGCLEPIVECLDGSDVDHGVAAQRYAALR